MSRRYAKLAVPEKLKNYQSRHPSTVDESEFSIFLTKAINGRISFFGEQKTSSKRDSDILTKIQLEEVEKPLHEFCTGSRYIGLWNRLGMTTQGVYRFPHGVIYNGDFNKVGEFDGFGTLSYPNGQKLQGIWENGKLTDDISFIFSCGEPLDEDFTYCEMPDRRFHVEIQDDFAPADMEYLTADPPPPKQIPAGCYDTGNGFYNPATQCIHITKEHEAPPCPQKINLMPLIQDMTQAQRISYIEINQSAESITDRLTQKINQGAESISEKFIQNAPEVFRYGGDIIIEVPTDKKIKWIIENCRRPWDEPTGYRPDLYEYWTVGRKGFQYSRQFGKLEKPRRSVNINIPTKILSYIQKPEIGKSAISYRRDRRRSVKILK